MIIGSIKNGMVIDHITAGRAMELYDLLGLSNADCEVALIKNAVSAKMGRKDIIKINGDFPVDINVIAYVDPKATINIIQDGVLVEKKALQTPQKLVNVVKCQNPRCITSTEQELPHMFRCVDEEHGIYRCAYCDQKAYPKK